MILRINYEPCHRCYVSCFLDHVKVWENINVIHLYNQILISGDRDEIISKMSLICSSNAIAQKVLITLNVENVFSELSCLKNLTITVKK